MQLPGVAHQPYMRTCCLRKAEQLFQPASTDHTRFVAKNRSATVDLDGTVFQSAEQAVQRATLNARVEFHFISRLALQRRADHAHATRLIHFLRGGQHVTLARARCAVHRHELHTARERNERIVLPFIELAADSHFSHTTPSPTSSPTTRLMTRARSTSRPSMARNSVEVTTRPRATGPSGQAAPSSS
ncbi:conserved hypothetical protein [Ricinus communis]|uniref:Uncharacterized protein n=1 Tax=Ricinus communis TaxID=3988 RepID=B9TBI0_RICCO|nr:conserved hypothetical protein [Ricinus communis]